MDINILKRKLTEALVYMESYKQNHYEGYFNQMENSLYELSKELNKKQLWRGQHVMGAVKK